MNAVTPHSAYQTPDFTRSAAAARRRRERRLAFEALLLRSYATMRARAA